MPAPDVLSLRDDAESVIRSWDAYERARGARAIIDYDFAPTSEPVRPATDRLSVYTQLTTLLTRAESLDATRIADAVRAHVAYLGHILGERPTLDDYMRATQGCPAAGWPADYVMEIGERAREAIEAQGASWGPNTDRELIEIEKPIDISDARDRVLEVASAAEPILRDLAGTSTPYNVAIEIHDIDDYWAYWVDGSGHDVRLRFNTRQATFTEVRLRHFVLHEVLGHGLQCSTFSEHATTEDVDWIRLSSVHLPNQTLLEGLAQAIPLFVAPDDQLLMTRVRIEHYQQLVRAELHLMINTGVSIPDCAEHAIQCLPWWSLEDIGNELSDRSTDPCLRSYLYSYPAGIDWFAALADTASPEKVREVLHAVYRFPHSPVDLSALWPYGPVIGGPGTSAS